MKTISLPKAIYQGIESGEVTQIRFPVTHALAPLPWSFVEVKVKKGFLFGLHRDAGPLRIRTKFSAGDLVGVSEPFTDSKEFGRFYEYDLHPEYAKTFTWSKATKMHGAETRLSFRVSGYQVQRLAECSEPDSFAEGVQEFNGLFAVPGYQLQPTPCAALTSYFCESNKLPAKNHFTIIYSITVINTRKR